MTEFLPWMVPMSSARYLSKQRVPYYLFSLMQRLSNYISKNIQTYVFNIFLLITRIIQQEYPYQNFETFSILFKHKIIFPHSLVRSTPKIKILYPKKRDLRILQF